MTILHIIMWTAMLTGWIGGAIVTCMGCLENFREWDIVDHLNTKALKRAILFGLAFIAIVSSFVVSGIYWISSFRVEV